MSMPITQSPVIGNQPVRPASQPPKAAPAAQAEKPKSVGDTLVRSGAGLMVGFQTGLITGGLGVGTYTALTSKAPAFHKALAVVGFGGMAAIGGGAAGAVGGAAAAGLAQSKSGGAAYGALAGGLVGAAATAAISIASKKFDPGAIAAGAAFGAAFGAAGGFASKALID
ncbi:MAG: hypothetical protein ACO1RX_19285 [Candidatus Sericytochromatia bacterium]